jgi:hypothetical protein
MMHFVVLILLALEPGEQAVTQCSGELAPGTEITYDRTRLNTGGLVVSATVIDTVDGRPWASGKENSTGAPLIFRGTLRGRWGEYRAKLRVHPDSDGDRQLWVTFLPEWSTKLQVFTFDCTHN